MRAVISNRIYIDVDEITKEIISKELTYKIPRYRADLPPEIIHNMRIIRPNIVSIPSGREDLIPEFHDIIDKRTKNIVSFPDFKYELRPDQQRVINEVKGSCIINAPPSWGKTVAGIYTAKLLKYKTLIVTHNVSLRRQWEQEVKKVLDITAGTIGSGMFNIDSSIVVGNVQSVNKKTIEIAKEFGTIILDECHHTPASTFSSILDTSYATNKIGLSATLKRKDGRHVLFKDYFGSNVITASRANAMDPSVEIIRLPIRFPDGKESWAAKLSDLCSNENYRSIIARIGTAYASKGHKVLITAQRVDFLNSCARLAGERAKAITGEVSYEDRDDLENLINQGLIDQVYATQSIFSEGISVNPLSALILAGPINNDPLLEQLIGRVERIVKGKLNPVIVDIHLQGKTVQKQASNRMNFYISRGYKISFIQ